MHRRAILLLLAAVTACGGAHAARTWSGTVTYVTDGDTVWVRPARGGAPRSIRVQGVDAPESCQAFGPQARDALERMALHQAVQVEPHGRDNYGRTLASLRLAGRDVGGWLVANGWAWSYRFKREAGPYEAQESRARQARLGLWSQPQPMEPRRFRRLHGSCRPPPG
ncbi:thermonuclease family protein [Ramlibacter humi]|uniref:Thermonuclease family protein n=1 Tax=Ramlibacter humi TaxID=2530451 RepID=A0A4Z0BUR9_9BURK|nr:thermonuclease family protein [Ramlibacter humi]TFZ01729.1 thermonuclease family protein [Ramlibacter humi]